MDPKLTSLIKPAASSENDLERVDLGALVKADEERRVHACIADVHAALAKHGCSLEPVVTIVGTHVASDVRIVALPRRHAG